MKNKNNALITGATSGIGYEMALVLAKRGYNLVLASRNEDKLETFKSILQQDFKITVNVIAIDLSQPNSAKKLLDKCSGKNFEIDILINNAGFAYYDEHVNLDIEKVEKMLQLNVITLSETCALFGAKMKEKRNGYILNVASTGAFGPAPYTAAYASSKSYVLTFSEAISKELEDYNVFVTCLSPGITDTNFFNAASVGNKSKGMFANKNRMSAKKVAELGINSLFSRKLSVIPGVMNKIMIFAYRLLPRRTSANMAKGVVKSALNSK